MARRRPDRLGRQWQHCHGAPRGCGRDPHPKARGRRRRNSQAPHEVTDARTWRRTRPRTRLPTRRPVWAACTRPSPGLSLNKRVCTATRTHAHTRTQAHTYMHSHIHTHTHAHSRAHIHASHTLMRAHAQMHTHTRTHAHVHRCTYSRTHIYTHTRMHTHTPTHMHRCTYAHTHTPPVLEVAARGQHVPGGRVLHVRRGRAGSSPSVLRVLGPKPGAAPDLGGAGR